MTVLICGGGGMVWWVVVWTEMEGRWWKGRWRWRGAEGEGSEAMSPGVNGGKAIL